MAFTCAICGEEQDVISQDYPLSMECLSCLICEKCKEKKDNLIWRGNNAFIYQECKEYFISKMSEEKSKEEARFYIHSLLEHCREVDAEKKCNELLRKRIIQLKKEKENLDSTQTNVTETPVFLIDGIDYSPIGLDTNDSKEEIYYLEAKDDEQKIYIKKNDRPVDGSKPLSYEQIINIEIIEEEQINEIDKSVIGRAVVGGVLLGPLGAIVGGMSGAGTKKQVYNKNYLVINYRSEDENLVVLSFSGGKEQFKRHIKNQIKEKTTNVKQLKIDRLIELQNGIENFNTSQKYDSFNASTSILIDEKDKKVCFISVEDESVVQYEYKDILDSEIIENVYTITSTSREPNAIEAITSTKEVIDKIDIQILVNCTKNPIQTINFYNAPTINENTLPINKVNSKKYEMIMKEVNHWQGLLRLIIKQREDGTSSVRVMIAEEIRKLSELKNEGILTEEEFIQQKHKLLLN